MGDIFYVIFVGDRMHLPQTHIFHLFIKIQKCILHQKGKNLLAKMCLMGIYM
jgi:hypothetical protein